MMKNPVLANDIIRDGRIYQFLEQYCGHPKALDGI